MFASAPKKALTESDKYQLNQAIEYVESVAPTGGPKLRKFLNGVPSIEKRLEILEVATKPEGFFWSWPNWKPAARAWMLTVLVRDEYWIYGDWQKPTETVIQGYLTSLSTKYQPEIDADIKTCFGFGPRLKSLETLQESKKRKLWASGNFTKPTEHKDSNFRYIVYAMTAQTGMPFMKDGPDSRSDYMKAKFADYLSMTESGCNLNCAELYLNNPIVLTTELLSCSVISQDHKKTYRDSPFGFILSVPYQNVCIAASSDLAVDNSVGRADTMAGMSRGERMATVSTAMGSFVDFYNADLKSPQEILAACIQSKGHNEILLAGSISGLLVQPCGIFIKTTPDGCLWESFQAMDTKFGLSKHIKLCALNCNIPIVSIKDDTGTKSETTFAEWLK